MLSPYAPFILPTNVISLPDASFLAPLILILFPENEFS